MKNYDVIVIGSGGGAKITSPAARLGLKVACLEKAALGGTCLNRGCIPSKMMIHPAEILSQFKSARKFGISFSDQFQVKFSELINRISQTVDADSSQIETAYQKNSNIDFYHAEAKFAGHKIIEVDGEKITADKIFIAAGARPKIPAIDGLENTPFMTSTEALRNMILPKDMIVIGGGYIAVELGYAYAEFGTEVHFLVRSRLLRQEDCDVVDEFNRVFSQNHHVHFQVVPKKVSHKNGQFTVTYTDSSGWEQNLTAGSLLVAAGVTPNTDTLGLEKTSVAVDAKGFIRVDQYLQTSVPGIYAFGDCIGRYLYRHTVNYEGEYLFKNIFEEKVKAPIQYPPVPHAVFTHPQIAGVGMTEDELKSQGIDYAVGLNSYRKSAMGMARLSEDGFCKILIERKTLKILGAHIIGDEASNMIHLLIGLMYKRGTLDDLLGMMYIHPALPEIVRNAARKAKENLKKTGVPVNA